MSAEPARTNTFALLLTLDATFVSTSFKNLSVLTHAIFRCFLATLSLSHCFTAIVSVDILSLSIINCDTRAYNRSCLVLDTQLFLQSQAVVCSLSVYQNCSLGLSADPAENSSSLINADNDEEELQSSEVSVSFVRLQQEISAPLQNMNFHEIQSGESRPDKCGPTNVSQLTAVLRTRLRLCDSCIELYRAE
jgi:hypothetical protein